MFKIFVKIDDKEYIFESFKQYLEFYQNNIHKTTNNFTKFINNAQSENDTFETTGDENENIEIKGATNFLSDLIKKNVPQNAKIDKKIEGWNPGCSYKIENKEYFCKVLSGDVDGNYSWANEIFAYKLMENLGIGPKCTFKTIDGAEPLTMITTESIYNDAQKSTDFPLNINQLQNLKNVKKFGVADLVLHIALIDDIYYNYHNISNIKNNQSDNNPMIFDVLAPPFDEDFNPTTQNDYNEKLNCFDSYRNECSSSNSLLANDIRDLGYLGAVREMQTKEFKEKFNVAVNNAFDYTNNYINSSKEFCISDNRKKIFDNLYSLEALEKYKDLVLQRFNNIDRLGTNKIEEGEQRIMQARSSKYEYGSDINQEVTKNYTIPFSKTADQYKTIKKQQNVSNSFNKWKNYKRREPSISL